jgi:hypothetical protein
MSIRGTAVSRVSTSGAQGEADIVAQFRARHLDLVRLAALLLGDSAAAEDMVQEPKAEGRDVVREIHLTPGGGTLISGRVLRPPSRSSGPLPVLVDPDGRELITMVPSPSAAHAFEVVKTSIATGRVVSVLGSVSPVYPLFGGEYLAVDRTGDYVLVWRVGNATNGLALHGWVHGGSYHSLAPAFPLSYPGGLYQMTW